MNRWFNPKNFMDLIERFNPFGFKQENGDTQVFHTYKDCYYFTMRKLYLMFPRGYCDMALFLEAQTKLPFQDSLRVVKGWKTMGVGEVMMIDFRTNDRARSHELTLVMKALHTISETKFNEAMFAEALINFDVWMETVENKELLEFVESNG